MSAPLLRRQGYRQRKENRFDFDRFIEKLEGRVIRIALLVGTLILITKVLIHEIH
jgi:hypothetical protein